MHVQQVDRILIGQLSVDSKADWETLQNMISNIFKVSTSLFTIMVLLFCLNLTDQRSCLLRKSSSVLNVCERHSDIDLPLRKLLDFFCCILLYHFRVQSIIS